MVHVVHKAINEFNLCFKLVFGLVKLESFKLTVIIDGLWQVVYVTYFNRFDLELIVLTLTDDHTLLILL